MKVKTFTLFGFLFTLLFAVSSAAAQDEKPKAVSAGVVNGKAVHLPMPQYPPAAKAVKAQGTVNVEVTVDEEGDVIAAEVVSGHPLLRRASEEAALKAKFKPFTVEGKAVKFSGILVYNFVAGGPAGKEVKETSSNDDENDYILNGRALKLPAPEYPAAAKAVKASGAVRVRVTGDEKGNVISAKTLSGHPLLRQAAENAALKAEFEPTLMNGKATKITGVIIYNFVAPAKSPE